MSNDKDDQIAASKTTVDSQPYNNLFSSAEHISSFGQLQQEEIT